MLGRGVKKNLPRVEFEKHSDDCSDCTADISDWEMGRRRLCETFPDQSPPEELWEKMLVMLKTK
jgi:hypothetical protein